MNKDEILSRIKSEGIDEREQSIFLSSFGFGNIITIILCLIFVGINGIKGQSYNEFITIAFASLSATDFYKYKRLKDKKSFLISSITTGFVAILAFVVFIVKG
ncbi:MAG: hypothetical protein H7Y18_04310 [Clostridiaceae bacterium]|nr:hypothetical protein [Clostridiaceae bacterium]